MADHLMDSRKIIRQIHDELAVDFILAEHPVARRMARIAALNQFVEDVVAVALPVQCDAVARRLAREFTIAQDLRAQSARYATSRMLKILPKNKIRDDCAVIIHFCDFSCAKRHETAYRQWRGIFVLLSFIFLFFAKIISMAMSFRMTSFAPREAITTAAAAGAVDLFSIQNSFCSNKSFSGLTARRRGILVCFVCFVVKNSC